MLTGPDVSEHQGDVDWKAVATKHELAIVRISDGDHRDRFFGERRLKAIREDNTITNLATGLTLREGPDSFMQTIYFNPDGTVSHIVATGLAVNVQTEAENLKDVGRVVWLPGTNEIVFSAGPHSVREALEFGTFQTALAAFCDVLA